MRKLWRKLKREAHWVLTAPLGKLPREESLKECAEKIRTVDAHYRDCFRSSHTIGELQEDLFHLVKRLLEAARGEEGVLAHRADGGGTLRYVLNEGTEVSVLTALGIHGLRSAYVLHFERVRLGRWGRIPHSPLRTLGRVGHAPPVLEELEVVQDRLLKKYPALREALSEMTDHPRPTFLVEVWRRGQVGFAMAAGGWATHVLVGERAFFALNPPLDEGVVDDDRESLARALRRNTPLGELPSSAVLALLQGEGDLEAAERVWVLARLATW